MARCRNCNHEIKDDAILCVFCGQEQSVEMNLMPEDFTDQLSTFTEKMTGLYQDACGELKQKKEALLRDASDLADVIRSKDEEIKTLTQGMEEQRNDYESRLAAAHEEYETKENQMQQEIQGLKQTLEEERTGREMEVSLLKQEVEEKEQRILQLDQAHKEREIQHEKQLAEIRQAGAEKESDYEAKLTTLQRVFLNEQQGQREEIKKLKEEKTGLTAKIGALTKELSDLHIKAIEHGFFVNHPREEKHEEEPASQTETTKERLETEEIPNNEIEEADDVPEEISSLSAGQKTEEVLEPQEESVAEDEEVSEPDDSEETIRSEDFMKSEKTEESVEDEEIMESEENKESEDTYETEESSGPESSEEPESVPEEEEEPEESNDEDEPEEQPDEGDVDEVLSEGEPEEEITDQPGTGTITGGGTITLTGETTEQGGSDDLFDEFDDGKTIGIDYRAEREKYRHKSLKFCPKCGTPLQRGQMTCGNCNASISDYL